MDRTSERFVTLLAGSPVIVVLCGSTRFHAAFAEAQLKLTLTGYIVLSVGSLTESDDELFADMAPADRRLLEIKFNTLHYHKIVLADEVVILDIDPSDGERYIGESTEREIEWAKSLGKPIHYASQEDYWSE